MSIQPNRTHGLALLLTAMLAVQGCALHPEPSASVNQAMAGNSQIETGGDGIGFAIIGDTGVLPPDGNLAETSAAMTQYCAGVADCSFVLMTGDNIYPKGATADPQADAKTFAALFSAPFAEFKRQNPQSPIIVSLGNHDWYTSRAGALAQVAFHEQTKPFFMDGLFYRKRVSDAHGGIDIFVIDTEMLLAAQSLEQYDRDDNGHMVSTGKRKPGGTANALPVTETEKQQLAWFETALKSSDARWKFIVAHHPLWQGRSDSKYTQSLRLRELLLPMACRYADAYFAGHQHTIEVHEDDCSTVGAQSGQRYRPLPVVVSGAGAKARKVDPSFAKWQSEKFPQNTVRLSWGETAGFVHAAIQGDKLTILPIEVGEGSHGTSGSRLVYKQRDDQ